jgi:hypothetical protein
MKHLLVIAMAFSLSGCALFTKTKLVPQAYMPEPPEILMREPKDLNTIKQEQPAKSPEKQEDK